MLKNKKNTSRLAILAGSCLMGSVGVFVDKLSEFPVFSISFFRGFMGIIFLTIFLLIRKDIRKLKILMKQPKWLFLLGFSSAFCIMFYFLSIIYTNFAQAAFLLYSGNVFAVFFFKILLKENFSKINFVSFILATLGVLCISEFQVANFNLGIIFGIISGILLGLNITAIKKFMHDDNVNNLTVSWWALLSLSSIFFIPSLNQFIFINLLNIWVILGLGLIPTALAFTLYNHGMKEDTSGDVLILSYSEPLVASIFAIFYQRVFLSIFLILGGILILISNAIVLLLTRKKQEKS